MISDGPFLFERGKYAIATNRDHSEKAKPLEFLSRFCPSRFELRLVVVHNLLKKHNHPS